MFKHRRPVALVLALVYLGLTAFCWMKMSPFFWITLLATVICLLMGMGLRWIIRTIVWFGVFWMAKLLLGSGIIAFVAASISVKIIGMILWKRPKKKGYTETNTDLLALLNALNSDEESTEPPKQPKRSLPRNVVPFSKH